MTKRFLVIPGPVQSKYDSDWHHVSAKELMQLYQVNPAECVVIDADTMYENHLRTSLPVQGHTRDYLNSLIHLTPRYSGDYSQFWL